MKKWKQYLPAGVLALVLVIAAAFTFSVRAQEPEEDTIPERVFFGSIDGGGMSKEEAVKAIEAYVEQLGGTKVTLTAGENSLETTAGELGLSWSNPEIVEEAAGLGKTGNLIARYKVMKDLEHEDQVYGIAYELDAAKVQAFLEASQETLNTPAVDASLTREDGEFVITPGSQGVSVNVAESVTLLEKFFSTQWEEQEVTIELTAEVVEPRGTEEELSKVQDELGSYHTNFSSSADGRVTNLQVGAAKINGAVIYPGEEFSAYAYLSPINAENGYELAGAYENGTTIESYGGGVCQVSTTLYNAAIRAELEITERYPHSMTVSYVEPSEDAAIAGTYKDLKFVNNTEAPIYIEGYTVGRDIYFTIYGQETRPENRKVTFESEILSNEAPATQFKAVEMPVGHVKRVQGAHNGISAKLWKIVTVDGVEESREEFNRSTYNPSPAIYEVGTVSANPEAVANINAALATQDEATIRAAAEYWSDEAIAQREAAAQQPATPPAEGGTTTPEGGNTTPEGGTGTETTPPAGGAGDGSTTPAGGGAAVP